jgi:pimeloyl-ACP methyl ester carboxylesterase
VSTNQQVNTRVHSLGTHRVEVVYPDLAYFNEVDRGGHFAAWEEPELFSTEVRAAFRGLR